MDMKDTNSNLIPDKFDPYVGAFFALAGTVLVGISQYTDPIPKWLPIVMGVLTAVASVFKFGFVKLPMIKSKTTLTSIAVLLVCTSGCGLTTHDVAVRTVRTLQQTRDLTGQQLAAAMRIKHATCKVKHGVKTTGFATCVKPILEAQDNWRKWIRPVVDTTAQAGLTAMQTKAIVDKCKSEKNCDKVVIAIIKPAVCAVTVGLRTWGHLLPDAGSTIRIGLSFAEGIACNAK